MQLTLKEPSDELSENITLFWVKLLTIIYFHSNIFLNTRSSQIKIFDSSSDSSSQLLLVLMFTNLVTVSKKSVNFKYIIRSMLFFLHVDLLLALFHLHDDLFYVQTFVSHCLDLSAVTYHGPERFSFSNSYKFHKPMVFKFSVSGCK